MKNNIREQRAITLVALIITIIVLLILAIVSINLVMNGGIIDKSKNAVDKYSQEEVQEQIKLAYSEWQMGQYTGVTDTAADFIKNKLNSIYGEGAVTSVIESSGIFVVKLSNKKQYIYDTKTGGMLDEVPVAAYPNATPGQANKDENTKYTSDNKTAVIPKGYAISSVATEQSIDNGLVIKEVIDNNNDGIDDDPSAKRNEWVWIPVANVTDLYTEDATGWTMSGTEVVTKYKSNSRTDVKSDLTRGNPGTTSWREPGVLNNDSYDKNATNLSNAGLGSNIGEAATKLRDDYKAMIDSVKKYGGFYVGRYELGGSVASPKVQYQQTVLTDTNWYNLYKACKDIDSTGVETRMIWGCQWDQVCKFINTSGDKVSLTNSSSYGNYNNSSGNANISGKGSKQVTGYSDYWKANNIYDIAGNCYEWTQEACGTNLRASRGGSCGDNGGGDPVTNRSGYSIPTFTNLTISSRPQLYVK